MTFKNAISIVILIVIVASACPGQPAALPLSQSNADSQLFVFEKDGLYGYTDARGAVVIEPQFLLAWNFSEGLAQVQLCTDYGYRWGFIDKTGKVVIAPIFDDVEDFSEGLAAVRIDGLWGFIDRNGSVVIQPRYDFDDVYDYKFSEGFAAVKVGTRWGYINRIGEMIIKPRFDDADSFSEGMAEIEIKKKHGYIDTTGKIVIKPQFDLTAEFSEGLARVNVGYRFGWNSSDPRSREGLWGYIDRRGKFVIDPKYDWAGSFSKNLAVVRTNGFNGFIDKTDRVVIDIKYERAEQFSEGLAAVRLDNKWGYIDENGSTVIPFKFGESKGFVDGVAPVNNWDNRINKKGEIIWTRPPLSNQTNSASRICEPKIKPPEPTPEEIAARRNQIHKLMLEGKYQHDGAAELIYIGDITSVPALLRVLKDNPPSISGDGSKSYICTYAHAVAALMKITGYKAESYEDWDAWWDQYQKTHSK